MATKRRSFSRWIILTSLITGFAVSPAVRAATPEQVDEAITKAKAFLYHQQKNGTWETSPAPVPPLEGASTTGGQWGGLTSIATYALLAAGDRPADHPQLTSAIDFLMKAKMNGVYAVGLQAQVWDFLPSTSAIRAVVARDGDLFLNGMGKKGKDLGFYSYTFDSKNYHHSPSQYGVLGMWACSQAGLEVPTKYWSIIDSAWHRTQQPDGGWSYRLEPTKTQPVKASMTAAGVATLFITQDYLDQAGAGTTSDIAIDKGLEWMAQHFNEVKDLYTWYGVERIGTASGYKYFGTIDWFKAGADQLVKSQQKNGSWNNYGLIPGTSFALLFLSRGRAPVVLNKLQYDVDGKPGNWNARRRDGANLVRWLAKQMERDLNWQIVNLKVPVEELHDAPILYLSGNRPLKFSPEDQAKLKTFIEQGGIILGNADQNSSEFANSFRKLGTQMFPTYEFHQLPIKSVIYTGEQYPRTKWSDKPNVLTLSNGVREMMILFPTGDLAKAWQLRNAMVKPEAFQLMSDIFLYAVDKENLHYKGQNYIELPNPNITAKQHIRVARLKYAGNWDPEPGGWQRMNAVLHNKRGVDLDVQTVSLGDGALTKSPAIKAVAAGPSAAAASTGFNIAHLTGTVKFDLTPAQIAELKKFVEGGGTLVVDAAGGSGEFTASAEEMLRSAFGSAAKQLDEPLPQDNVIYHLPGAALGTVTYRSFARQSLSGNFRTPRLRGIVIDGRTAVIYSPIDLSAGLVGQPVDGIVGYSPESATELMSDVLLYGAFGDHPPAVVPPPAASKPGASQRPGAAHPAREQGKK